MCAAPGDIVLDFFSGSGTTAAVCHKLGLQYIAVEQLNYYENDDIVRLKNVIQGDPTGISDEVKWKGGGTFVSFELKKWNQEAKESLSKCKSLEELFEQFKTLSENYFLNYNVRIKEFQEKIVNEEAFKRLSIRRQKEMFLKMLDLNQLYVNASEMEDKKFRISNEDTVLTKSFYNI